MKETLLMMLIASTFVCNAQSNETLFTDKNFDIKFLTYQAVQGENVTQEEFEFAQMVLSETKKALNNDVNNYNVAHYWNIATAFSSLQERKENIEVVFLRAVKSEGVCEYFESFKSVKNHFSKDIPVVYDREQKKCLTNNANTPVPLDLNQYARNHGLDIGLVELMNNINQIDHKFRDADYSKNAVKQIAHDKENQVLIDSLYVRYETYIGISLVGEKFSHVMWAVIQHSNPEMMGKYLPVIQEAVENEQINETPLKMLIDRFYGLKYGYQVFGSQSGFGFKMADAETKKEICQKYGIE